MRKSRRAGLTASGLVWDKYEYTYVYTKDLTGWRWSGESTKSVGAWNSIGGYEDYEAVLLHGETYDYYELRKIGSYYSRTPTNTGTLYLVVNNRELITRSIDSSGNVTENTKYLVNNYTNERWEWWVQDHLGTVRAKEGEYPDAGRGLTFDKVDGEYTIMTDGTNHYAYKLRG